MPLDSMLPALLFFLFHYELAPKRDAIFHLISATISIFHMYLTICVSFPFVWFMARLMLDICLSYSL